MNDTTEIVPLEVAPQPFVLTNPTPLQLQMIETAEEMGLDVDWYKEHILSDEQCLNGLELIND